MLGGMNRLRCPRDGKPTGTAAACVLTLAGLLGAASAAPAQGVEKGSVKDPPAPARTGADAGPPYSNFGNAPDARPEPAPTMASLVNAEPQGWEFYLKGGAVFPLGDGFFEKHVGMGWTVQMGLRQPLFRPADRPWMMFAEFGAGYTASTGRERMPVTTSGVAFFPNDDHVHQANDFYDTQLIELQRGFVQGAVGVFYYPPVWNSPGERLFHVNARLGVRSGGMRTIYNQKVQRGLLRVWEAHAGPNGHGHDPRLAQYFPDAKEPELFFGMFGSVGASMTFYDARLFGRKLADITLGAEIEIGHEWFDAGAYGHNDPGFGSYTPMLSVSFSF